MEFMCRSEVNKGKNAMSSWGGIPVVVFLEDDVQLPPVLDCPVFKCTSKSTAAMHGCLVWKEFDNAIILNTVVRLNENQLEFKNVLSSLRNYNLDLNQAQWLQRFQWDDNRSTYDNIFIQRLSDNGLFVFPTHNDEWDHNKLKKKMN